MIGESVYNTRAWVKFGEGPTEMGSGHAHEEGASFTTPVEGKPEDIRFTRSKDQKTLYAILMGWPTVGNTVSITSLGSAVFPITNELEDISFLSGQEMYIPVKYHQDETGLHVSLPEKHTEEMAYVLKLKFKNQIPNLKSNNN